MINHLEYKGTNGEHRILEVGSGGGDYFLRIRDMKRDRSLHFRFSGSLGQTHHEVAKAMAALHDAIHGPLPSEEGG